MNNPSFDDFEPRYAPEQVIIAQAMKLMPVKQYVFYPAGTHKSAIKSELAALELKTDKGSRWYGCERAYINSELKMVVVGCNSRDEVRMKWPVCHVV